MVLVDAARSLIGTPFRHHGRTRLGVDCVGLVVLARRLAFGISEDDCSYTTRPTSRQVMEKLSAHGTRVPIRSVTPGDVAVLRFGPFSSHLGIVTPTGVVHSIPGPGVVEHSRDVLSNRGSIVAAFRLRGTTWQR